MNLDKKGVIDLPVKLMVVILIVSLSVPLLADAVEKGESENAANSMNMEMDKIFSAVAAVHYSGIGSSRSVSVAVPQGCEIVMPGGEGSDAYRLIGIYKEQQMITRYMDRPPVRFITGLTISGECMLLVTSDIAYGEAAVRVVLI